MKVSDLSSNNLRRRIARQAARDSRRAMSHDERKRAKAVATSKCCHHCKTVVGAFARLNFHSLSAVCVRVFAGVWRQVGRLSPREDWLDLAPGLAVRRLCVIVIVLKHSR